MYPIIVFDFFGQSAVWPTNTVLILACGLIGLAVALFAFFRRVAIWRIASLVAILLVTGLLGGRLFHALFERPELWKTPSKILTEFDGMTFYGSLALGLVAFILAMPRLFPKSEHLRAWDIGTIMVAFSYGVLRLGCFANGCCWGRICSMPWAVRYFDPNSAMPVLGIPVHPVQLYDAMVGFFIFGLLIYLYRHHRELRGQLFAIFCITYAIGRFITEDFRGDSFRGEDVIFGLSTSQALSVALFTYGVGSLAIWLRSSTGRRIDENIPA